MVLIFLIKHFPSLQSSAHNKLCITFRRIKERNQLNLQGTSSTLKLCGYLCQCENIFYINIKNTNRTLLYVGNILDITKHNADRILQQYERDKVFLPEMLWELLFNIIAKDNADLNSSSNAAAGHYYGTSMTLLQLSLSACPGKIRNIEYELTVSKTSKKVDKLPKSYTNVIKWNLYKAGTIGAWKMSAL